MSNIGDLFKERRKRIGLTQAQAARRCSVGTRFVSELENGKPTLRMDKVVQALRAFGLELTAVGIRRDWPVRVVGLKDPDDDLRFWLSRTPEERVEAVGLFRARHFEMLGHKSPPRIAREIRVVPLKS